MSINISFKQKQTDFYNLYLDCKRTIKDFADAKHTPEWARKRLRASFEGSKTFSEAKSRLFAERDKIIKEILDTYEGKVISLRSVGEGFQAELSPTDLKEKLRKHTKYERKTQKA